MTLLSSFQIDEARHLPLDPILARQGLVARREGSTTRYKNDAINIVLTGQGLWFDNAASVGGRGAIDLALHLHCHVHPRTATPPDFQKAIRWLSSVSFESPLATDQATIPRPAPARESFASQAPRLAIRDDARWPLARHYLVHARRLPDELVDGLYQRGDLYASYAKARPALTGICFLHRQVGGEIHGATIRIVAQRSGVLSIGEKQNAWFTLGDPQKAIRAIVVEAPIDAMSLAALRPSEPTVILAASGAHVSRSLLQIAHERSWPLLVGFDNDRAGKAGWERCREDQRLLYPEDAPVLRIEPQGKDWNDDLRATPRPSHRRSL
jgi:hypothetical protein